MKNRQIVIITVVVALVAMVGGFYAQQWYYTAGSLVMIDHSAQNSLVGTDEATLSAVTKKRPEFTLMDINNQSHSVSEWDGKVLLVNFWATWCPPCIREMPTLNKLNTDYQDKGFVVIGIAIDSLAAVKDFLDPLEIEYPILLAEQQGLDISQAYGNRLGILPFSVIVNRQGQIVKKHRGEISYQQVEALIKPLL